MKYILLVTVVSVVVRASWETSPSLAHIELSRAYEAKVIAQKNNIKMCQKHVAKAIYFRDTMANTPRNQEKLIHYKNLVIRYCSEVANCKCRR